MKGDRTHAQVIAELGRDPAFAEAWALGLPRVSLAENVWKLREARGLTQAELAAAAGMKQPRIAEMERGDANPTLETLARVARALGVPVAELLAEAGDGAALQAPARRAG